MSFNFHSSTKKKYLCAIGLFGLTAANVFAQSASPELSPLCTDRPTKSNFACVVDQGHFQYETDVVNASQSKLDGTTTNVYLLTNPTLKYGIAKDVDIELNAVPYQVVITRDASGAKTRLSGPGDLYLRVKWNFHNSADGRLSIAALPYLKAPTARHGIGNGAVEGGFIVPVNYKLTDSVMLTTVPQIDWLKDASGSGRHANTAQLINVGWSLPRDLTLYAELWGNWNFDPQRTVRQLSADMALAWLARPDLQFDIGLNVGLNHDTPRMQGYLGVSQKF